MIDQVLKCAVGEITASDELGRVGERILEDRWLPLVVTIKGNNLSDRDRMTMIGARIACSFDLIRTPIDARKSSYLFSPFPP
jgi:hypothetical protein